MPKHATDCHASGEGDRHIAGAWLPGRLTVLLPDRDVADAVARERLALPAVVVRDKTLGCDVVLVEAQSEAVISA